MALKTEEAVEKRVLKFSVSEQEFTEQEFTVYGKSARPPHRSAVVSLLALSLAPLITFAAAKLEPRA